MGGKIVVVCQTDYFTFCYIILVSNNELVKLYSPNIVND